MKNNIKKYMVRISTAALCTVFMVGTYQNCSVYQYEPESGTVDNSSTNDDNSNNNNDDNNDDSNSNTDDDTTNTTLDTNNPECLIQNLADGGTKQANSHTFTWSVLENQCTVMAKINDNSWETCNASNEAVCKIINNQYTLEISQYGTSKISVMTLVNSEEILNTDTASVTLQRDHLCDSYQECMNKNTVRRRDCDCEPTNPFGDDGTSPGILPLDEMCYALRCGYE